jgi:hypothetical protein
LPLKVIGEPLRPVGRDLPIGLRAHRLLDAREHIAGQWEVAGRGWLVGHLDEAIGRVCNPAVAAHLKDFARERDAPRDEAEEEPHRRLRRNVAHIT